MYALPLSVFHFEHNISICLLFAAFTSCQKHDNQQARLCRLIAQHHSFQWSCATMHGLCGCRMPFDCKLGLQRSPGSTTPLHLVHHSGGMIPQTLVLIQRKHATIMWQRTADGRAVTQSLRSHSAAEEDGSTLQAQVVTPI